MGKSTKTIVYILVTPGVLLLDLAGIAEPIRLANRFSMELDKTEPFDLRVISPNETTQSSLPISIAGCTSLPDVLEIEPGGGGVGHRYWYCNGTTH